VIWQGHPMDNLEQTLEQVKAGKYDLAKARERSKLQGLYEQFRAAAFNGDDSQADKIAEQLTAAKDVEGVFPNGKFDAAAEKKELRAAMLQNEFARAVAEGDNTRADKFAAELKNIAPEIKVEELRGRVQASKYAQEYFEAITGEGKSDKAGELGPKLAEKLEKQPGMANQVAWAILTHEKIKNRDIPLALKLAKRACEDSDWKEAAYIDTYARALYDSGRKDEAVSNMKKALAVLPASESREEYEQNLKKYQDDAAK